MSTEKCTSYILLVVTALMLAPNAHVVASTQPNHSRLDELACPGAVYYRSKAISIMRRKLINIANPSSGLIRSFSNTNDMRLAQNGVVL